MNKKTFFISFFAIIFLAIIFYVLKPSLNKGPEDYLRSKYGKEFVINSSDAQIEQSIGSAKIYRYSASPKDDKTFSFLVYGYGKNGEFNDDLPERKIALGLDEEISKYFKNLKTKSYSRIITQDIFSDNRVENIQYLGMSYSDYKKAEPQHRISHNVTIEVKDNFSRDDFLMISGDIFTAIKRVEGLTGEGRSLSIYFVNRNNLFEDYFSSALRPTSSYSFPPKGGAVYGRIEKTDQNIGKIDDLILLYKE